MAFIHINKQNFYHNLNQIALKTGAVDKIAIVLKDNAYGHGLVLIAKLASEFGIKHAVVRDLREAKEVKSFFDTVLVLAGEREVDEVCSFALNSLADIANTAKGTKVELKVDTGMHRNGIPCNKVDEALALIQAQGLDLVGVMTHYRAADILSAEYFWQSKRFETVKNQVEAAGFRGVRMHSHNSAAILRTQHFDEDLVRVGIAAYGYNELDDCFAPMQLKPVLSLHAKKVSSIHLQANESIGYAATFTATRPMQVSTYNIGYGDGWLRACSDVPYTTEEGLTVLGRVSMDLMSFETSQEEICILSNAQVAAKHFNTISYEIVTALNSDIPRYII